MVSRSVLRAQQQRQTKQEQRVQLMAVQAAQGKLAHQEEPQGGGYPYNLVSQEERLTIVQATLKRLEQEHWGVVIQLAACEHDCHVLTRQTQGEIARVSKDLRLVQEQRIARREGCKAELRRIEAELALVTTAFAELLASVEGSGAST